nr:retrovirus-related Pol polyprotein from transposon TNT 1-94 [Tanacetum cinerariifolium]
RSSNLYTIALNEVALNSSTCLLAKASSSQSWLWHQRLSHLNFATINNLVKNNLVQGLPKIKFEKDHLCSACEQRKIHRKHHKSKTAFASNKPLYLLHMDLCGSMRVQSINGKRYVLVVVMIIHVQRVQTDNGAEFKNKTLAKFSDEDVIRCILEFGIRRIDSLYSVSSSYIDLVECTYCCKHCKALFWYGESFKGGTPGGKIEYYKCYRGGKVALELELDSPDNYRARSES